MTTPTRAHISPVNPTTARRRPLGLDEVEITGGFWRTRQDVNGAKTLPHVLYWLEREGWVSNFDAVVRGTVATDRRGREFSDSEVYKYLEAAAWELGRRDDSELEAEFRRTVNRIAAAQEPDGYLGTQFGNPGQQPRWSDMEWGHELYCLGHLFQAVVARLRTRPDADDGLVNIGRRAADLVCETFGADGLQTVCGHAEIESAMAELGRALNEPRYIEQARLFVERRGHRVLMDPPFGREYYQDDVPVREASALRGHSVRANYFSSGVADVADETDDSSLFEALERQWDATIARRTYITGGQGSRHLDEAFGFDYELPPDRAYSETCAGIASVQFSWRMLLAANEDATQKYGDLIERTLYNVVATSPGEDGQSFYYSNTLHQREPGVEAESDTLSHRAQSSLRAPWFDVSCCPPNVARTLASLAAYVATIDGGGVQLHQYAPSSIRTNLSDGTPITLDVQTDYPTNGQITVRVLESADFMLSLRIPDWAAGATVDGEDVEVGTHVISRYFQEGDTVVLQLPVAPRFTYPSRRIDAIRGTLAVERGPEVYCLESVDLEAAELGNDIGHVTVDATVAPTDTDGTVRVRLARVSADYHEWPYKSAQPAVREEASEVALVPYHRWAERGRSTMRVWLPTT